MELQFGCNAHRLPLIQSKLTFNECVHWWHYPRLFSHQEIAYKTNALVLVEIQTVKDFFGGITLFQFMGNTIDRRWRRSIGLIFSFFYIYIKKPVKVCEWNTALAWWLEKASFKVAHLGKHD